MAAGDLLARVLADEGSLAISKHQFFGGFVMWKLIGHKTRADFISAFTILANEELDLDWPGKL